MVNNKHICIVFKAQKSFLLPTPPPLLLLTIHFLHYSR